MGLGVFWCLRFTSIDYGYMSNLFVSANKKVRQSVTSDTSSLLVLVAGLVPLAETPRSGVINAVLCQQVLLYQIFARQSVLLP